MAKNLEHLLGGYATGTLTADERESLCEAALDNQELFNLLADEEALKELLDDPESRRRLLDMLEEAASQRQRGWLTALFAPFHRPLNLALVGGVAVAAVAFLVFTNLVREAPLETRDRFDPGKTAESARKREQPAAPPKPARSTERRALPPSPPSRATPLSRPAGPPEAPEAAGNSAEFRNNMLDASTPAPAFRLSLRPPFVQGPARQLFDNGPELRDLPAAGIRPDQGRVPSPEESSRQAPKADLPAPSELPHPRSPHSSTIGLNLGLEIRGTDGAYVSTNFDSPLEEPDQPRLVAEANAAGYLYAGELEANRWRWLFPQPGPNSPTADASVQAGQRIAVPVLINSPQAGATPRKQLWIVLSRQPLAAMETSLSGVSGSEVSAEEIRALLERRPVPNEGPIVEKESGKGLYLVVPTSAEAITIELHLLP